MYNENHIYINIFINIFHKANISESLVEFFWHQLRNFALTQNRVASWDELFSARDPMKPAPPVKRMRLAGKMPCMWSTTMDWDENILL